jgi:hypothetical protein
VECARSVLPAHPQAEPDRASSSSLERADRDVVSVRVSENSFVPAFGFRCGSSSRRDWHAPKRHAKAVSRVPSRLRDAIPPIAAVSSIRLGPGARPSRRTGRRERPPGASFSSRTSVFDSKRACATGLLGEQEPRQNRVARTAVSDTPRHATQRESWKTAFLDGNYRYFFPSSSSPALPRSAGVMHG